MAVHSLTISDGWVNAGSVGTIQLKSGYGEVLESASPPTQEGIELQRKEVYVPVYEFGGALWVRSIAEDVVAVFVTA